MIVKHTELFVFGNYTETTMVNGIPSNSSKDTYLYHVLTRKI